MLNSNEYFWTNSNYVCLNLIYFRIFCDVLIPDVKVVFYFSEFVGVNDFVSEK